MGLSVMVVKKREEEANFYSEQLSSQRGMLSSAIRELSIKKEKLEESITRLENRNHELKKITYHLFHSVRGPITTLLGLLELMKDDSNNERTQFLIDSAKKTINDLDNFSTQLASSMEVLLNEHKHEEICLDKLVEHLKIQLGKENLLNGHEITVEPTALENYPVVQGEKVVIQRLLRIFLSNSLKFTKNDSDANVKINYKVKSSSAIFCIEDDGPGMDKNVKDRATEMFYKGDTNSEGYGIGLYLADVLINERGGGLRIICPKEGGTKVIFVLPLS